MSAEEEDDAELRDILLDKVPEEVADKILVHLTRPFFPSKIAIIAQFQNNS